MEKNTIQRQMKSIIISARQGSGKTTIARKVYVYFCVIKTHRKPFLLFNLLYCQR